MTRELGSIRKLVKKGLEDNDYHAVEQDNFPLDYRDLTEKLRERIDSCDAVVHIAGYCYGAEPRIRPDDAPRRSYTQREYEIAVELGKPVYVFLTGDGFPVNPHELEPPELRELQEAHRRRLTSTGKDYSRTASREELAEKIRTLQLTVERLKEELQQVNVKVAQTGRGLRRGLLVVLVVGLAALGAVGLVIVQQQAARRAQEREQRAQQVAREKQELERRAAQEEREKAEAARQEARKIVQVEQEFAERFLQQLLANKDISPEDARNRALKELPSLVKLSASEIESLVNRKIPPATQAALSLPERARAALAKEDYAGVHEMVDKANQESRELAMIDGTAALAEFRKTPRPEHNKRALAAFQRAMALADPNSPTEWKAWTDAAVSAASILHELGRFARAEPLLRECVGLHEASSGPRSPDLGLVLNDLAGLLRATNRLSKAEPLVRRALAIDEVSYGPDHPDVARDLNNLASLLGGTNQPSEAEPLFRRALAIAEVSYWPDHSHVATALNNLAGLLYATNRPSEAEPLFRRALAIVERSYGPDHPHVAVDLNNLASLLRATNRPSEAEPLFRLALAIDESSYGPDHPDVATDLNNLAGLLYATNRPSEAEPLFRRALAIDEVSYGPDQPHVAADLNNLALLLGDTYRLSEAEPLFQRALAIAETSYGPDHPDVATDLNNLAELLRDTNRPSEAEPLFRRALAIDEVSYGPDHPDVARDLNGLAPSLWATNRLSEAEPFYRRALLILARFQVRSGHEHPNLGVAIENYGELLAAQRLTEQEIALRIKAAMAGTEKVRADRPRSGARPGTREAGRRRPGGARSAVQAAEQAGDLLPGVEASDCSASRRTAAADRRRTECTG